MGLRSMVGQTVVPIFMGLICVVHLKGCVDDHVIEDRDVEFVLGEGKS